MENTYLVPRYAISLNSTALVGLTNGALYFLGSDSSLNLYTGALRNANAPMPPAKCVFDLGDVSRCGSFLWCEQNNWSLATGIAGATLAPAHFYSNGILAPGWPPGCWTTPAPSTLGPFGASGQYSSPAAYAIGGGSTLNNDILATRWVGIGLTATTWPSAAAGLLYFTLWSSPN